MKRSSLNLQVTRITNAASERVRAYSRESGNREVLSFLDTVCNAKNVFMERARYIDTVTVEAARIGDTQLLAELREMSDEFVRDLNRFKFLAETGFEALTPKEDENGRL